MYPKIYKFSRQCRICNVNSLNLDSERYNFNYLKFHDVYHIALNESEDEQK